jgi:hypothetical protein
MVLTSEELSEAEKSVDVRIKYNLHQRATTNNFIEQACFDRKIQQILKKNETIVYQFNNFIVRNASKFVGVTVTNTPGWNYYGPDNETVKSIIKIKFNFSIFAPNRAQELVWLRREKKRLLADLDQVIKEELHFSD